MVTKVSILAAARKIVAAADAKKRKTIKKNPAPRIGTKKPNRRSQATGKAPTKRLVQRRKANAKKGYFPNPTESKTAHEFPFAVQVEYAHNMWKTLGLFAQKGDAVYFAQSLADKSKKQVKVLGI